MSFSRQQSFQLLLCLIFTGLILAPMITSVIQPDKPISLVEKRNLQQWPAWSDADSLKDYFSTISKYANDQFGFRDPLLKLNQKLKWWFAQSPSRYVIRGKEDWLFLKVRDPLLSETSKSKETITNIVKRRAAYVRKMHLELAAKGVAYQHIVASNKLTVYPEFLPAIYNLTNVNASYDLYKSLFSSAELEQQIFTEQVLNDKKADFTSAFYFKNDTHWNFLGAQQVFLASLEKLARYHPELKLEPVEKNFRTFTKHSGDLAKYIGLDDQMRAEEPRTKFLECAQLEQVTAERWDVNQSICGNGEVKILMIGDSFMRYLFPYYSEAANTVYMVKQNISRARLMKLIDELKPDLVIEELVERHIPAPIPK